MKRMLGIGEAGRVLNERPTRISDGFQKRWFDERLCPLVAGRRVIPASYLPTMAAILAERARGHRSNDKQH